MGQSMYNCAFFSKKIEVFKPYKIISLNPYDWSPETCGRYHRTGPLCGECITGYYPQVYSLDISCRPSSESWSNWAKYLLAAYAPLTVFCLIILLFRINITASRLQGHVFFCQLVSIRMFTVYMKLLICNQHSPLAILGDVALTVYGIWNLDFFRAFDLGICLRVRILTSITLDLAIALYPLGLMALIYVAIHMYYVRFRPVVYLWRPFRSFFHLFKANSSWKLKASVVDAFATVFVLSNVKFQSVCLYLLIPMKVYYFRASGNVSYHWNVCSSSGIRCLSHEHLPFFILALCILVLFIAMPFFPILLYPFRICQFCLNLLSYRWQIILRSFVDTFQGCYKNGTESGSWDCRWFAVLPHFSQFVAFLVLCIMPSSYFFIITCSIILVHFLY